MRARNTTAGFATDIDATNTLEIVDTVLDSPGLCISPRLSSDRAAEHTILFRFIVSKGDIISSVVGSWVRFVLTLLRDAREVKVFSSMPGAKPGESGSKSE